MPRARWRPLLDPPLRVYDQPVSLNAEEFIVLSATGDIHKFNVVRNEWSRETLPSAAPGFSGSTVAIDDEHSTAYVRNARESAPMDVFKIGLRQLSVDPVATLDASDRLPPRCFQVPGLDGLAGPQLLMVGNKLHSIGTVHDIIDTETAHCCRQRPYPLPTFVCQALFVDNIGCNHILAFGADIGNTSPLESMTPRARIVAWRYSITHNAWCWKASALLYPDRFMNWPAYAMTGDKQYVFFDLLFDSCSS